MKKFACRNQRLRCFLIESKRRNYVWVKCAHFQILITRSYRYYDSQITSSWLAQHLSIKIVVAALKDATVNGQSIEWRTNNSGALQAGEADGLTVVSGHVETVVVLSDRKVVGHIGIDLDIEKLKK